MNDTNCTLLSNFCRAPTNLDILLPAKILHDSTPISLILKQENLIDQIFRVLLKKSLVRAPNE